MRLRVIGARYELVVAREELCMAEAEVEQNVMRDKADMTGKQVLHLNESHENLDWADMSRL